MDDATISRLALEALTLKKGMEPDGISMKLVQGANGIKVFAMVLWDRTTTAPDTKYSVLLWSKSNLQALNDIINESLVSDA